MIVFFGLFGCKQKGENLIKKNMDPDTSCWHGAHYPVVPAPAPIKDRHKDCHSWQNRKTESGNIMCWCYVGLRWEQMFIPTYSFIKHSLRFCTWCPTKMERTNNGVYPCSILHWNPKRSTPTTAYCHKLKSITQHIKVTEMIPPLVLNMACLAS